MTDAPNTLGEYLRARRELVTPEQVGIPVLGVRRVPGLRREEVAMLSGISAEYYLRLEQGRDRHPSAQVLEAIARVLRLDDDAYLLSLVDGRQRRGRPKPRRETLPASTARLIDQLPFPAFAEGRHLDVLAANALAAAVSPRLVAGRNRLRDVFLDEAEQDLFEDWERAAAALLAGFRRTVGRSVDDPRVVELVGELSLASPEFRRLWARHDIAERTGASVLLDHPAVGRLRLEREKLAVAGTDGIMLVVYHAQPGSGSAERLALLGSMAARTTPGDRAAPTRPSRPRS
ncbi:helix-turn-helix domain-containing protein [Microbacterium marinilacus]|uniref:Helix-turn-helix transcriptional regulator n=1 Tax=Microbacterium marinilacus TaxID=415209 RepID=A0ABP7BXQ6_9MICO|nr:helix-turn-helix transcriptional regulator [Microbacterium marinilacus]MBY0688046.1 helix-turn-helix transcriptional regulator [Microbacterium marinilacus]